MVPALSGQWCFGVLLHISLTRWGEASVSVQQLWTFWRPHTPQPDPWDSLHHHTGCESFLLFKFLICTITLIRTLTCLCACQACTGGGCTFSPPAEAQTEESTPENVPAPLVTPLSPHALNVSWTPPETPNGEKTLAYKAKNKPNIHKYLSSVTF